MKTQQPTRQDHAGARQMAFDFEGSKLALRAPEPIRHRKVMVGNDNEPFSFKPIGLTVADLVARCGPPPGYPRR